MWPPPSGINQAVDLQQRFTSATVVPRRVGAGLQNQGLHAEFASASTPESSITFFMDGCAVNANSNYIPVRDTSRLCISASSLTPRLTDPSAIPRFASMIAMDGRATPSSPEATVTGTLPTHEKSPILNGLSKPDTATTTPSLAQPLFSESRKIEKIEKIDHVRQPSSPARRQIESQVQPSRGHKRTATGDVKIAVPGTQSQVQANGVNGHSRTMSLDSTGSKIAEVIPHFLFAFAVLLY